LIDFSIAIETLMEIYSVELDLGQLKIEVSIQITSPRITFDYFEIEQPDLSFNVYLTARDKEGRRLWRTPVTDMDGKPQVYSSLDDALSDATSRFQEEIKK
jgi:hypothetical protein